MKAYKTWFTNKWIIEEVETDDLKMLGTSGHFFTKVFNGQRYGSIYDRELYKTEDAAQRYINHEYVAPEEIITLQELAELTNRKKHSAPTTTARGAQHESS